MANIEHKDIVDPNIHEPKGISTAPNGYAYLSNGLGGGGWAPVITPSTLANTVATALFTATKYLDNIASGSLIAFPAFNIDYDAGYLFVANNGGGFFPVRKNGIYQISFRHIITIDVPNPGMEANINIKPVRAIADNPLQVVQFPNFNASNGSSSSPIVTTSPWFHGTTVVSAGQGIGFWATGTYKGDQYGNTTNVIRYTSVTTEMVLTRLGDA
jgi:hypothetical protein